MDMVPGFREYRRRGLRPSWLPHFRPLSWKMVLLAAVVGGLGTAVLLQLASGVPWDRADRAPLSRALPALQMGKWCHSWTMGQCSF